MKDKCKLTEQQCKEFCDAMSIEDCASCDPFLIDTVIFAVPTNVFCAVHDHEICTNCNLASCAYYTQYPNVYNCILVYMAKQEVESLSPIDISVVTQIPSKQVSTSLQQAMTHLRGDFMDSDVNTELEPSFITLTNHLVCANCEKPVSSMDYHNYISDKEYVVYCSEECMERKPAPVIMLEKKCKTNIGMILQWAVRKYSTLGALEQALGMNRHLLGQQLRYHLNIDASTIYNTTQRVRTRNTSLSRRTGQKPRWLVDYSVKMRKFLQKSIKKHGKPQVNTYNIRMDVKKILNIV